MIALRNAIDRASKRRWVWLLVMLALAALLVFVALHSLEHAVETSDVLLCITIGSLIVLALRPERMTRSLAVVRAGRDPPAFAVAVARTPHLETESEPLRQ
ncbi:MAG: hypothetical protein ACRDGJ_09275 [Candidatus Limnocylindria bacterium]